MSDLANVFAAPIEVELGGRTWQMGPITLLDLGKLQRWSQTQAGRNVLESAGELLTVDERKHIIDGMLNPPPQDAENMAANLGRMDEIIYLLWLATVKNHPTLTLAEFGSLVNMNNVADLQILADRLAMGPPETTDGEEPNRPPLTEATTGPP